MNEAREIKRPSALITGASAGLGAEFARQLARAGYDLVLVARRQNRLDELGKSLEKEHGINAESLVADLADPNALRAVENRISSEPRLEMLVNNAGFGIRGYFADTDIDEQERMIRVHCIAPARLSHAALPAMIARDKGAIVNVASVAGFAPSPGSVNYHATKAYALGMSEALHLELIDTGVYVQALCPGFTITEFHDVLKSDRRAIPKSWWMDAEDVVGESLREAFRRDGAGSPNGRVIVVPGARYRRLASIARLVPRTMLWNQSIKRSARIKNKREKLKQRARDRR